MKRMSQKRYTLDPLGSRVAIRVMRCLFDNLHRYQSVSELSSRLDTSRANVHRGVDRLDDIGIIRRSRTKGRSMVRIDTSSMNAKPLFLLLNNERVMNLDIDIRNAINQLLKDIGSERFYSVILFGSHAMGTATEMSDVDLLIVIDDKKTVKEIRSKVKQLLPEIRMDLHFYEKEQFRRGNDLVLIEAKLHGISIRGVDPLFEERSVIDHISKDYLLSRSRSVQENLERSRSVDKDARAYFLKVARRTLTEISDVLPIKIKIENSEEDIEKAMFKVKEELSKIGDRVWLN